MSAVEFIRATEICLDLGERRVLADVSISLRGGEVLGVIGPNGAGKTSLLRVLAGLAAPASGTLDVDPGLERLPARGIGYLPQSAEVHWPLSVERVVALGRLPHLAPFRSPRSQDAARIAAAMRATDTTELAPRSIMDVSGGERARVLLARVLAGDPRVILADEPVAGLDPYHQLDVMSLFRAQAADGRAVVMVMHDLTLAGRFCDRLVLLDEGRVAASGVPAQVLTDEVVARVYRVAIVAGNHAGERYMVPWTRS
ncbi:MAG: ABC transporter ATP-binding protein [Gammaproteobacteria bacterium]|nr:ABC transporter ATP-binding protein [Gammaproteobacteria bacterium]